jgi:hypothetical protein
MYATGSIYWDLYLMIVGITTVFFILGIFYGLDKYGFDKELMGDLLFVYISFLFMALIPGLNIGVAFVSFFSYFYTVDDFPNIKN